MRGVSGNLLIEQGEAVPLRYLVVYTPQKDPKRSKQTQRNEDRDVLT